MSSNRDPKVWIGDILDSIQEIEDTICNVEEVNFLENHVLINAVSYALLKITEAVKHLLQSDIDLPSTEPWTDIYSLATNFGMGTSELSRIKFGILPPKICPRSKPRVKLS